MSSALPSANRFRSGRVLCLLLGCLAFVIVCLFYPSFKSEQALFANDGPLGSQASRVYALPSTFFGIWNDLNWVGAYNGNYSPNFTGLLLWLLGPVPFNKFYVPLAQIILGLSAAYFFTRLRFKPVVCVLGGLAAALNSNFFSNACWGLASRSLSLAAAFLALAAVQAGIGERSPVRWFLLAVLGGLGVGLSVSEGGDNGAFFAIFVGSYAFHQYLCSEGPVALRVAKGAGRVVILVLFSAALAAQTMNVFVHTAVKGIVGIETDTVSPEQKWNMATQWSLPPVETLRVVVPGLFGYRMDTPDGGNYWGGVGRDLSYDKTGQGFARHSGAGEYAGVLVVLIALWAFANSLRKTDSSFSVPERKMIWFWSGACVVAVLLAWGHHAPFYQFIYKLPYFSTIRNPMKFMHPGHLCLLILFAYGLQGIWRRYLETSSVKTGSFEKKWLLGSLAALGVSIIVMIGYTFAGRSVEAYLAKDGFDSSLAQKMFQHSTHEVMLAVFFLAVSIIGVLMIQKGVFSGPKSKWAGVLLGLILAVDLARANAPWIKYYDYKDRYASNHILEMLARSPYEHRIALPPFNAGGQFGLLAQYYTGEWLQQQFPYYNIQSLDQPQEPRMPAEKAAYRTALATNLARMWELTNTRFLAGMSSGFAEALNQQLDPVKHRFRVHTTFNLVPKPGIVRPTSLEDLQVAQTPNDPFAIIEFTGALPRVKLYTQWQTATNAQATLKTLADPAFDPAQTVLVAEDTPVPAASSSTNAPVSAEIVSYAPKTIEVKTSAPQPAILLMNNRFDEGWRITVDGKPASLLRCNFLMQGVYLPANAKNVLFTFVPKATLFYVTLSSVMLGLLLCGLLTVWRTTPQLASSPAQPQLPPSPAPKTKPRRPTSK